MRAGPDAIAFHSWRSILRQWERTEAALLRSVVLRDGELLARELDQRVGRFERLLRSELDRVVGRPLGLVEPSLIPVDGGEPGECPRTQRFVAADRQGALEGRLRVGGLPAVLLEATELDEHLEEVAGARIGLGVELIQRAERFLARSAVIRPRPAVEDARDRGRLSHAWSQRERSPAP